MDHSYWQTQDPTKPLFPDIEWSKPEHRSQRGRLGIIGGNKLGFAGVAEGYSTALTAGVGEVRVLLPDMLKKSIPAAMTDVVFGASNPSGGLSRDALLEMQALAAWSSVLLLSGDAGRNSETAIVYEDLLQKHQGPLVLTRDAIDLVKNSSTALVERPDTLLVMSFAQLQKLFQAVYYPKVLTFSMQLMQLVEAVHKFTITYPITVTVLHKDTLIVAYGGDVTTTAWENPMAIWRGTTAARAASYWAWNPSEPLQAVTASLIGETRS
jgi:NAD(P)H-hydrate repair Nnr-like enzyme with NAD(P)H-hydrate dehydratase domain